jgi:hypothetical protein
MSSHSNISRPQQIKPRQSPKADSQRYLRELEDERGWAGQHGQHPENEEETNFRSDESKHNSPSE